LKGISQEERDALVDGIETELDVSLMNASDVPEIYEPLSWSEIREMLASGLVSFGNHTVSHYILARCTPGEVERELATARGIIESRIGSPCDLFCYPNGGRGDFDAMTRDAVRRTGHRCALTTVSGLNGPGSDPYELRRVGVMEGQSFEDFEMLATGLATMFASALPRTRREGDPY
jgi:peptidoglycan/xylan/chitin deacetylase (PgdA/CDA1 family)